MDTAVQTHTEMSPRERKRLRDRDRMREKRLEAKPTSIVAATEFTGWNPGALLGEALTPEQAKARAVATRRDWECRTAAGFRGGCSDCGHSWRPRNPSPTTNRCPGCGARGTVTYTPITAQ
jgi:hypothetical protein